MDASSSNPEPTRAPPGATLPARDRLSWTVPPGARSWAAHAGGLLLLLLAVQVATGVLLMFHYRPGLRAAESVAALTTLAPFGWLVRGLHAYASHALLILLLIHLAATYALRAARPPRHWTWMTGIVLFALCLAMTLTGAVLPGDQQAVTSARVAVHLLASVPLLGSWLADLAAGGLEFSNDLMHRALAWHAAALPLAGLLLVAVHLSRVRAHGLSRPPSSRQSAPFYPDFLLRHAMLGVLLLFGLAVAAAVQPPPAPLMAEPLEPTPAGFRPAWVFLPLYQLLRALPPTVASVRGETLAAAGVLLGGAFALSLPCWSGARRARIGTDVVVIAMTVATAALGIWGGLK